MATVPSVRVTCACRVGVPPGVEDFKSPDGFGSSSCECLAYRCRRILEQGDAAPPGFVFHFGIEILRGGFAIDTGQNQGREVFHCGLGDPVGFGGQFGIQGIDERAREAGQGVAVLGHGDAFEQQMVEQKGDVVGRIAEVYDLPIDGPKFVWRGGRFRSERFCSERQGDSWGSSRRESGPHGGRRNGRSGSGSSGQFRDGGGR